MGWNLVFSVSGCRFKERMAVEKRYKIPLGTEVEIISGCSDNGRIGTFGAREPSGIGAHNVHFSRAEYDFNTFMDDEIVPVQNIITIDNLEYETLCEVFNHEHIYETDRIIVKQKRFTYEEIEAVLEQYSALLAEIYSKDADFGEEGICIDNRGKVLDLLQAMLGDNYSNYDNKVATAIEEAIMYEQWQIEGFRKHLIWSGKDKNAMRYFNPEAKIETIFI